MSEMPVKHESKNEIKKDNKENDDMSSTAADKDDRENDTTVVQEYDKPTKYYRKLTK